jgi:hypothetical protein
MHYVFQLVDGDSETFERAEYVREPQTYELHAALARVVKHEIYGFIISG